MCYRELPNSYTYLAKIDLEHNKRQFLVVNLSAVLVFIAFIAGGWFIVNPMVELREHGLFTFVPVLVLILSYLAYIVLHELTHGAVMYLLCRVRPVFGVKLPFYAYCGSSALFDKSRYALIALAPCLLWGIVFGVLAAFFHSDVWFWVIWLLQAGNIGGATGDIFVACKLPFYPKDVLIRDSGTDMTVYRRKTAEELARDAAAGAADADPAGEPQEGRAEETAGDDPASVREGRAEAGEEGDRSKGEEP